MPPNFAPAKQTKKIPKSPSKSPSTQSPVQYFYLESEKRKVGIATVSDPLTRRPCILWQDIQESFPRLSYIRAGRENLPLNPNPTTREIHASPEIDHPANVSVSPPPSASSPASLLSHRDDETSEDDASSDVQTPLTESSDITPPSRLWPKIDLPVDISLFVKQLDIRGHLEPYLTRLGPQGEDKIRQYDRSLTDYATIYLSEKQTPGQLEEATKSLEEQHKGFTSFVTQRLGSSENKKDEHVYIRERLQMAYLDGLNRLATMRATQTIATQTFKLQERTPPRLFIVLPKGVESGRVLRRELVASDFRLYFLCECEAQTEEDDTGHVHLTQHDGYDLLRPDEFFSTFGSYALSMMEMVKYGVASENFVVHPLMTFKLLDGLDMKSYVNTRCNIQPKVDEAIHFLQSRLSREQTMDTKPIERRRLSANELVQLESFLDKQSDARLLGNLSRSVSSDDIVQWVCSDHSPHAWIEDKIARAAKAKKRLSFKCCSPAEIAHFCDVLEDTPLGLKELDVSVPWKASEHEIQSLCNSVLAAGVTSVRFNNVVFSSLAEDAALRGDPLKPILQLQSSIGSPMFSLTGPQILSSIQEHDKSPITGLRKLNVHLREFAGIMRRKLSFFIQRLPDLTELCFNSEDLVQGFAFLLEHIHHLPQLTSAVLQSGEDVATYYPSSKSMKFSDLAVQFDKLLKTNKSLTNIIVPFDDDLAMCDIRTLDALYRHRQAPLVAEFVNDDGPVIKIEYRGRDQAEQDLDGYLRCIGEHSVMYLQVFCDKYLAGSHMRHIEPDVACILPNKENKDCPNPNATLDFLRLKVYGVPAVLEALSVTEANAFKLITSDMHCDLRWLALARLKALSWSKLSRLEIRGTSMVDWMQRFPFVFKRDNMDSLQEFCVASNGQLLSDWNASWIESMLKSHSSQEPLKTIMLHDVDLGDDEWDSLADAIDLSGARTLQLTGSSLQQEHFEKMIDNIRRSPLETVCLRDVEWAQSLDESGRKELLLKLRIKARNAKIQF
ncbi:hypothetical protein BGX31_010497 [Mortierella sp. GBA43]|nr:hypothetical protein BGX31_010497 [Mortierella sp. GBA43]